MLLYYNSINGSLVMYYYDESMRVNVWYSDLDFTFHSYLSSLNAAKSIIENRSNSGSFVLIYEEL